MRINYKGLALLLAAVVILGGGLFFLHSLQSDRIADALLWQASRAKEKGDLNSTVHFLRRYLEFRPNDLEERATLGRTLADPRLAKNDAARERALFVLEQAVSKDPARLDLRRPLARIAIELRQYDLAWPHLEALQKRFPKDGEVCYLLAQWYEAKEKLAQAEACYRRAIAASPDRASFALRLAELLRIRLKKPEEARQVIAEARRHAVDDIELMLADAELAPAAVRGNALKDLVTSLTRHPKEPKLYQALARLEILENQRTKAERWLRDGLQVVSVDDQTALRWTLAHLLLDINRPTAAEKEITGLRNAKLAPGAIDYLLARADICRGQWARAAQALEMVRPKLERSTDLSAQLCQYLGQCYEQLDDPIRRLSAFEQAVSLDPESAPARLGLASARWALGHLDLALKDYREAIRLPGAQIAPAFWSQYIRLLIARGQQQGDVDWTEVEAAFKQAESKHPKAVDLLLLRAEALTARDRPDEAWDLLFAAKADHPRDARVRTALLGVAESRGQLDKVGLVLEEAERDLPDNVDVMLARARLMLLLKGNAATADVKKLAERGVKLAGEECALLLTGLADACYRSGNLKEALRYLTEAARLPPRHNDLRLRLRLFDLCLQAEDDAALERVLGDMRRIEGERGSWWQFATAARLVWLSRREGSDKKHLLQEAETLLDRVRVQRPQWSAVFMAKAEIAELRGHATEARTYYNLATEGGESNRAVVHQLVRLGESLAAKGEPSLEAEQKLRLAIELDPSAREAWVALVKYLATTGRLKEAEATLARAAGRLDDPLTLAACHEAVGRLEEAQKTYLKTLADHPADGTVIREVARFYMRNSLPRAAEPYLRRLLTAKIQNPSPQPSSRGGEGGRGADVAWAKRALAMVLGAGNDYPRFLEALNLVGLHLDGPGKVVEDPIPPAAEGDAWQQARARVLAAHPSRLLRARSIQLLEDLSRRHPLAPDDQLLLAQLYEGRGAEGWVKARELFASLVIAHRSNPAYLARYAECLLDHGETARTLPLVARLEELEKARQLAPGVLGSLPIKARGLELSGRPEAALALLKAYAAAKDNDIRRLLLYAACLARLGRLTEALDECERALKTGPPEPIIGASLSFLRLTPPAPESCERVEQMIQEALGKKPRQATAVVLQIQQAELHDLRGRYDEAEVLYRKVLEADKNNPMALNNLAWLLAQRKGKGEEALSLIARAIERLGPRPELLDTQAVAHLARRRGDLAIVDLKMASKDAPSASRYFNLARAYHMANNSGAALEAFQKAKAFGLKPDRLHPVERAAYDKIVADLKER